MAWSWDLFVTVNRNAGVGAQGVVARDDPYRYDMDMGLISVPFLLMG